MQPREDTANDLQQLVVGICCGVTWDRHGVPFASKVVDAAADSCSWQLHVQQLLSEVRETSEAEWARLGTSIGVPGRTMMVLDTCHDVFCDGCVGIFSIRRDSDEVGGIRVVGWAIRKLHVCGGLACRTYRLRSEVPSRVQCDQSEKPCVCVQSALCKHYASFTAIARRRRLVLLNPVQSLSSPVVGETHGISRHFQQMRVRADDRLTF